MKKNVGTIDALLRIMLGLIGLSWSTARMARYPYKTSPFIIAILSAMKVAEGITRFCPMLALMRTNTRGNVDKKPYQIADYPRSMK
ncbi:YgaP family membrane protein [Aneurinibacillus tyrosinisolvens]|uniref:YgaP family membrane protein n=1 Tax=Aneurinibacillus tyrosinisolvens TaxID=1443435 RepID=UPI00063EF65B|nr:DUF2892 domain-containing protein [Aneurinibacillus tyrosinisolvens]